MPGGRIISGRRRGVVPRGRRRVPEMRMGRIMGRVRIESRRGRVVLVSGGRRRIRRPVGVVVGCFFVLLVAAVVAAALALAFAFAADFVLACFGLVSPLIVIDRVVMRRVPRPTLLPIRIAQHGGLLLGGILRILFLDGGFDLFVDLAHVDGMMGPGAQIMPRSHHWGGGILFVPTVSPIGILVRVLSSVFPRFVHCEIDIDDAGRLARRGIPN
mmetsp:Transcript_36068/g.87068  ORF Transcript_36068/g.87068 Transcript_36068/m.87068 type:complete len:214 (+) Transcript_36068:1051-1692(+)